MASGDQRIIIEEGLAVRLRRSPRARRMTLRVPRDGSGAVLTLPVGVPLAEGQDFARSNDLSTIAEELGGRIAVGRVDVDAQPG